VTRRKFITLLSGAAVWPLAARAQQQRKTWRVGFLAIPLRPAVLESSRYGAFAQGMRELGYVEGDNLAIEYRFAAGKAERLSDLVTELLELKPDVLVVAGTPAVRAAQEATTSIPIVMATTNDPIGSGFVQGLARPGGNITGLSNLSTDLSPKLMEMLRSIAPKLSHVAILVNPTNQSHAPVVASLRAAAHGVNLEIGTVEAATPQEIESAFSSMNEQSAGAVIVAADAFFIQQGRQIAELARKHRMPSVFSFREQVDAGLRKPQKWDKSFSSETGKRRFASDCVVGPGGLELRARHTVHSNRSLCRSDWPGARETCAVSATEGTTKVLRKDHGRRAMWIAAVEGSRKMKPENPSFMCGLRGGLGGLELRAGDFFPPDFPVPPIS
jgi:ABC-type uncharacterized transport system substrate-binding protein